APRIRAEQSLSPAPLPRWVRSNALRAVWRMRIDCSSHETWWILHAREPLLFVSRTAPNRVDAPAAGSVSRVRGGLSKPSASSPRSGSGAGGGSTWTGSGLLAESGWSAHQGGSDGTSGASSPVSRTMTAPPHLVPVRELEVRPV